MHEPLNRRRFLRCSAGWAAALALSPGADAAVAGGPKKIAALVTEFRTNSHAEVIAGRWLEGFALDGKAGRPESRLASLFTDQVPAGDLSRPLAKKHGLAIYPSIREALCLGGDRLAVDGVLLIGEHGNYPYNDKGQHLYPRRKFFEEVVRVFRDSGRSVPVFSDKHLSYSWENAKWMVDRAAELKIPFMAGSSVPMTWRRPAHELEAGSPVEEAVVTCYGGLESYGFHGLEALQCVLERRRGGETGVAAVTCLEGPAVWKAAADGLWSRPLLDAALAAAPERVRKGRPEDNCKQPAVYLIEYADGCRAALLFVGEHLPEWTAAVRVRGRAEPWATWFWTPDARPYFHFVMQVQGIDRMFVTGRPSWPVERTLLTTGVLDAAMTSRHQGHQRLATPHLAVRYGPGPAWRAPAPPPSGPQLPR